jgi:formylglycine-generating enzyme required for sulfatase activity
MANLEDRTTCVDTENERASVPTEPVVDDMTVPTESTTVNQFAAPVPCAVAPRSATVAPDGTPFYDEEVCIPGGAYMLGSSDVTGIVLFEALESIPERVAVMPPLLVDKYEVTVGRWRRARLEGFLPVYDPNQNAADTPLPAPGVPQGQNFCTYSNEPLVLHSREAYPVNCVGWDDARAFCQYMGGDLLTEAQWEYIATGTADYGETLYPWGNDAPSCDTQIYAREYTGDFCYPDAYGPALPGTGSGDVTPLGVRDLGGSMEEWVLDSPHRFDARCWASIGLSDPRCWEEGAVKRPMRGGGWGTGRALLASLRPSPQEPHLVSEGLGFRCARSGAEPSP